MGTYQVFHDNGWPTSRIEQIVAERPPSRFPEDFTHVANVQANGLREAVELTTDTGGIVGDAREWKPWEKNGQAEALVKAPRDTVPGDVVVDPGGKAYRVEDDWFTEVQSYDRIVEQAAEMGKGRDKGMERE